MKVGKIFAYIGAGLAGLFIIAYVAYGVWVFIEFKPKWIPISAFAFVGLLIWTGFYFEKSRK